MTPDTLAKANAEHSHQRALFAWANMAARFGFAAAWDDLSYTVKGHAAAFYNKGLDWQDKAFPVLARLHAIPNGGYRDAITAGKLKAEGVKRGVPDVFLPLPTPKRLARSDGQGSYCGLYVELKRPKSEGKRKGETSPEQDDWIAYLRSAGYAVEVAFDWRSAAKAIEKYVRQCG